MEKNTMIAALLLVSIVALSGCTGGEGGSTGTLTMKITDAPPKLNIEKAVVTLSKIQVHKAGGADEDPNATMEAGWHTVVEESKTFDLIEIKGVKEMLGTADLEAGKYTQVRLSLDSAKVTIDGTEHDLNVPSDKLKLTKGFDIVADQETVLTLDFDAAESIHAAGDKYQLKPTIKIIQE